MIIERAELPIHPDRAGAFAEMLAAQGKAILASADGCMLVQAGRGIENPDRFILLLGWRSVEHHVAFTKTDSFAAFRALLADYVAGAPAMEHFALL